MLTAAQLRQRKIDTIKLCLSFAFAVKHYLRGEDGLDWDDYVDVVPPYFLRGIYDNIPSHSSGNNSYTIPGHVRSASPDSLPDGSRQSSLDATKRIRVKRSIPTLSSRTPLLQGGDENGHKSIDVHADVTMPLPIMHVASCFLIIPFRTNGFAECLTKFLMLSSNSRGKVIWTLLAQRVSRFGSFSLWFTIESMQ